MKIYQSPRELQATLISLKKQGKTIAFAPTMGNLHAGHLSLIEIAKSHADIVVSSIFVNPKQFGPNEDFDSYPRTLERDIELLTKQGCDILFTPSIQAIYPLGEQAHTRVTTPRLTQHLCGASRPTHFEGVTTIVNILFNIVQPDVAIFGKKDYQQLKVIEAMCQDLLIPIKILGAEISREADGLALSSRNSFLSESQRKVAPLLRKTLLTAKQELMRGKGIHEVVAISCEQLSQAGFKIDYFEVVCRDNFEPASNDDKQLLIAAAAWLGTPRLIDNIEVSLS
ncbi:pantoate--beta-alanine ligase [Aliikangiella sp. IMCC44653]